MKPVTQFFEDIHKAYANRRPFVMYKCPGSEQLKSFVQGNREIQYLNDYQEPGFVMAPFDSDKKPLFFALSQSEFSLSSVDKNWVLKDGKHTEDRFKEPGHEDKEYHLKMVNRAISKIEQGLTEKIVLSRKERVNTAQNDPLDLFSRLIVQIPQAFTYVWYHPEIGMWAGASPEKLVSEKNGFFHTMALAGTQKYVGELEVKWGDKDREEQQFVTDQICALLGDTSLSVSEPYTKRARNLLHICTDIKGQLPSGSSIESIIKKLHPTAAVCGLPVEEAKKFIIDQEGYDRKFYTGYLGEINMPDIGSHPVESDSRTPKQSQLYVNLRCMEVETQRDQSWVNLFVGGGITAASKAELEWEETVEKSSVIKSILS